MVPRCLFALFLFALLVTPGCSAPAPVPQAVSAPPAATRAPSAPTAAPAPAATAKAQSTPPGFAYAGALPLAVDAQRKIIKSAKMQLTVEDAAAGVDRLTGVTTDMGGYVVSARTFVEGGYKAATLTFAVPVDRFEEALRRVRAIALVVDEENASGEDVTDQYVDLESQLRNLQATANRIREFLGKAQTVEEALKVNAQLAEVEKQIETVKGRMNYVEGRSAFSTITVELRQTRPSPTPTPTLTPTPTRTPAGWHPDQTFRTAVDAQASILRGLTELAIWLIVLLLPYALVAAALLWVAARVLRGMSRKRPPAPPAGPGPE